MTRPSRIATTLAASVIACTALAAVGDRALELRNVGIAELENERPAEAEKAFRELEEELEGDPLPAADLAIALLRQQKNQEALAAIDRALGIAPGRGELLAIRGEVLQWSGRPDEALAAFRAAAAAAPDDPEIQYALLRQSSNMAGEEAEFARAQAAERLAELRPENVVVLLERGRSALAAGDRTAATTAYARLGDLVWQAPDAAGTLLEQIEEALEAGDLEAARLPGLRLENVLKVTPMYKESLRELSTGIQGIPLLRLRDEPPPSEFGPPLEIRFEGSRLSEGAARAVVAGDFTGEESADLAWTADDGALRVRLAASEWSDGPDLAAGGSGLATFDLDNDGRLDLLAHDERGVTLLRAAEGAAFEPATEAFGLTGAAGRAAAVIDFDIEGDLDLVLGGGEGAGLELHLNALDGPLTRVGADVLPATTAAVDVTDLAVADFDRDGDLDLLVAGPGGLRLLDNLRQGEFADRTAAAGLERAAGASAVVAADLDNDGLPDVAAAGEGLTVYRNLGGSFEPWAPIDALRTSARFSDIVAADFDNDGRLDLAVAGDALAVLLQRRGPAFGFAAIAGPDGARSLAARDLDGDGDVDLVAAGGDGVWRLDNVGGNENRWLSVRLRGLNQGNSKNNVLGFGSVVEVRAGRAYQFRHADTDVTHFGLGTVARPDLLRVVWTNGVPQNRLAPTPNQRVVEEQLLKGSCPFLYAWDGEAVRFVTDLLWAAPAGLPVAPGVWAGSDPSELVRVDGARPRDGLYDLRVTEELWEAAFLDHVKLWVVDRPADLEVASNLRVLPGRTLPEAVHATADVRPVAHAIDAAGTDVTDRVRERDAIYADGWEESPYQGLAADPWTFTFDLGSAPGGPIRLLLDGWIFPTDASLNLALAQRDGLRRVAPRLEVETAGGWRTLVDELGFPAGKTKTMVVDTPPLPEGARSLRIVSDLWLSWDRIAWSTRPADDSVRIVARLAPLRADLRFRGFSKMVRRAPNAPHVFDYDRVTESSPWLPFPGRYTRFGDVRELLAAPDDRSVVLAAGDELRLAFDASDLPPPPPGWERAVFLESHGWDKDADRNTWEAGQVEPLPFRAMSGYPYGPGESFPDTPLHRRYREEWLTREVAPQVPGG